MKASTKIKQKLDRQKSEWPTKRLELSEKYPVGILNQSKMGEFLAPVVHAIDILAASSGFSSTSSKRYLGYQTDADTPSCIRKSLEKPALERFVFTAVSVNNILSGAY